jgi:hypothetical protein
VETLWAFILLILIRLALEPGMPFRGLLSHQMEESIKVLGYRHYVIAWLPTWWLILACSFTSAGVGIGCAVWAMFAQIQNEPVGLPILIGSSALVSAFAGLIVPITLAWFKDRSEQRQVDHLKHRVVELEAQVALNTRGHADNAVKIEKVAAATQKIVDTAAEAKELMEKSGDTKEQGSSKV